MGIFLTLLGAVMNRVRGTYRWKGKLANDLVFGATMYWLTKDPLFGTACFAAMWIGRSFSWATAIGMIIIPAQKRVWRGVMQLSTRGILWTAMIAIPYKLYDHDWALMLWAGILMGPVYWVSAEIMQRVKIGAWGKRRGHGWPLGEVLFGGVLWLAAYAAL